MLLNLTTAVIPGLPCRIGGVAAADYVHADCHDIHYLPQIDSVVYSCNDGGILGRSWG